MKIKVKKIKYDPTVDVTNKKLPTTMEVEANDDFVNCIYDISENYLDDQEDDYMLDNLEMSEYIGELIEERVNEPVFSFEWRLK